MREARGNSCQLELEGTVGKEECGTGRFPFTKKTRKFRW